MHQIRSNLFWIGTQEYDKISTRLHAVFIHHIAERSEVFLAKTIRDMDSLLGVCD